MALFKQFRISDGKTMLAATVRNYGFADFRSLRELQAECFPPPFPSELWWNEDQLREHVTRFPDGALCAVVGGRIVGSMTAMRMEEAEDGPQDWETVTAGGYITNHNPAGDTLYVVDICVAPAYRKFGLGKWLMQSMYETVVHLGCRRLLGGGRMPGYRAVSGRMTAERYVERVAAGELQDPVLTFLLRCGRLPVAVVNDYLEDEQSLNYAALMEWRNPFAQAEASEG